MAELLDLSRLDGGAVPLAREVYAVRPFLTEVLDQAAVSGVQVKVSPPGLTADADPARLHQVVANLLHDAARHGPAGGEIRVRACPLGPSGGLLLEVADGGRGIPHAERARVFERFTRGGGGVGGNRARPRHRALCRGAARRSHRRRRLPAGLLHPRHAPRCLTPPDAPSQQVGRHNAHHPARTARAGESPGVTTVSADPPPYPGTWPPRPWADPWTRPYVRREPWTARIWPAGPDEQATPSILAGALAVGLLAALTLGPGAAGSACPAVGAGALSVAFAGRSRRPTAGELVPAGVALALAGVAAVRAAEWLVALCLAGAWALGSLARGRAHLDRGGRPSPSSGPESPRGQPVGCGPRWGPRGRRAGRHCPSGPGSPA